MRIFTCILPILTSLLTQVKGSGVFEVLLISLSNDKGMTSQGECCNSISEDGSCDRQCRTFATICLMHYQTKVVRTYPSCTFGQFATDLLGGNNVDLREETGDGPYTVKLPFSFTWPESFTLIIEVWHDQHKNRSISEEKLILRVKRTDSIHPSADWRREQQGNRHSELTFAYRVVCDENYYGAACERLCRARDDQFGHYTCSSNGTKLCLSGWQGAFCDRAVCHKRCNHSRGFCDSPVTCRCRLGWHGEFCEHCVKSPDCRHGYCHAPWQCICKEGWSGLDCNIDTEFCVKKEPCLNGGVCSSDWMSNYTCICRPGFTGENCQTVVCYNESCYNGGICQERGSSVVCLCPEWFTGERCEESLRKCDRVVCENNGSCVADSSDQLCECQPGYRGPVCQEQIPMCSYITCENGGTCKENDKGYHCDCTLGFTGDFCEKVKDLCNTVACQNGGKCSLKNGRPRCKCRHGFKGHNCEEKVTSCPRTFCANGGSCRKRESGWHCNCRQAFTGRTCRIAKVETFTGPVGCKPGDVGENCNCVEGDTRDGCGGDADSLSHQQIFTQINHQQAAQVISTASTPLTSNYLFTIIALFSKYSLKYIC